VRVIAGAGERGPLAATAILVGSLSVLAAAVLTDARIKEVAVLVGGGVLAAAAYRVLLEWRVLIAGLVLVVLFIPIKRYSLPGSLPFDLEPYRVFVAFILLGWVSSLLIDPRVRLRATGFGRPLALLIAAIFASELANPGRVAELGSYVAKSLTVMTSFVLLLFLLASVLRTREDIEFVLKVLVGGGAVVAATLLFERRFLYNVFDHLEGIVPFIRQDQVASSLFGAEFRLRVVGSAQHPIAMGAALAILVPPAMYLAVTTKARRWWIAVCLLGIGTIATASRTAFVMLVVAGLVLLALRWRDMKRLWPAVIPLTLITWAAAPGAVGTLRATLLPPSNLLAEQRRVVPGNEALANGRLADIGPAMDEFFRQPLFGQGFGTRITGFDEPFINAPILDNQWLLTLLETGMLGVAAFVWLLVLVLRRLTRLARTDTSPAGWLGAALTASFAAFAVGMFTFDALGFVQVAFLFFILLGVAGSVIGGGAYRSTATPP
jgi:O-antigen ligase